MGSARGSSACWRACDTATWAAALWAFCTASAARRAMSVMRTTSSGACGRAIGPPHQQGADGRLRGSAAARRGRRSARRCARAPLRPRPPGRAGRAARRDGPGRACGIERGAQLGELVLVGVGESGEPQRARVDEVHGAPAAEPGHHDLRHNRDGQLDRQRLAQQLARFGEIRHPGAAALVNGPQPARLDGHGDAVGHQLDEVGRSSGRRRGRWAARAAAPTRAAAG